MSGLLVEVEVEVEVEGEGRDDMKKLLLDRGDEEEADRRWGGRWDGVMDR